MAEVLVLVDHVDGEVTKSTTELLTLARRLGEPAAVFVGPGAAQARGRLAEFGAQRVYVAEATDASAYVATPEAHVLSQLVAERSPVAVLLPATTSGKEVAGRVAVRTGSGVVTDASDVRYVDGRVVAEQAVFGGSTIVVSTVVRGTPIIAVRPSSIAAEAHQGAAEQVEVTTELSTRDQAARVVERVVEERSGRPELAGAPIVVAGGRGVGSAEHFAMVEALADALGAAVGASRAVTDAGWYPHQHQVGQTGKTVSPQLYVAVGISGAIQHRAGMQTARTIVVINRDGDAPLFELADFGVVGDLHKIVPALTEEINRRKG